MPFKLLVGELLFRTCQPVSPGDGSPLCDCHGYGVLFFPPLKRTIIFKNFPSAFKNSWVKVILNTQIQHISSLMHLIKQKLK